MATAVGLPQHGWAAWATTGAIAFLFRVLGIVMCAVSMVDFELSASSQLYHSMLKTIPKVVLNVYEHGIGVGSLMQSPDSNRRESTGKVNIKLPGKGNSNSHGARPVHQIITMMEWIRTSRLSIKMSLSPQAMGAE